VQHLDADTLSALRTYAAAHGRAWKAALRADWMRAAAPPALQALRNTLGPSGLATIKL
jgi:plasmid stability protein